MMISRSVDSVPLWITSEKLVSRLPLRLPLRNTKMAQLQHTLNLLIRRILSGPTFMTTTMTNTKLFQHFTTGLRRFRSNFGQRIKKISFIIFIFTYLFFPVMERHVDGEVILE